jgi:HAD superfamily hydrolase (TIGR01509 family)
MRFRYAVFDLDMTLVDSIAPLMTSANLLAREFGLPEVTYEDVLAVEKGLVNATFESLWESLWGRYDPNWYEVYRDRLAEKEYAVMTLYPGGRETLEALRARGVGLGLASNRDLPRRALAALGVDNFFQAVVGQLDVPRPKPAPDMLLRALELMGAVPEETVYIGDSKGDIKCATAAGVRIFSLTTGGHDRAELTALGAWKVGDSLPGLLEFFQDESA